MHRLQLGPSQPMRHVAETTDTSGYERDACPRKKKALSNKTFRMKKVRASDELAHMFVTWSTDLVANLGGFFCQCFRRDVSVVTHCS